jgi:hypothetical protein
MYTVNTHISIYLKTHMTTTITKSYPSMWNNIWYTYTPRPGIDPYIHSETYWSGALIYAMWRDKGMSEEESHNAAEKAMILRTFPGIIYEQMMLPEIDSSQGKKIQYLESYNWPPMFVPRSSERQDEL